jgi:hypothetical protein
MAQVGSTTSPRPATPTAAISEPAMTWLDGARLGNRYGGAHQHVAHQQHRRHRAARTPDAGHGLVARPAHCQQIDRGHDRRPAKQIERRRRAADQRGGEQHRSHNVGDRKKGRKLTARNQLPVLERRRIDLVIARHRNRFAVRQPGCNHAFVAVGSFIHTRSSFLSASRL